MNTNAASTIIYILLLWSGVQNTLAAVKHIALSGFGTSTCECALHTVSSVLVETNIAQIIWCGEHIFLQ